MTKFATYVAEGEAPYPVTGFYDDKAFKYPSIPEPKITLSDSEWADRANGSKGVENNKLVSIPDPVPVPMPIRTLKSDIWRRCTDEEAEACDEALAAAPVRMRRLWNDSTIVEHESPEFALVRDFMVAAFGETRANEILAPSNPGDLL